MKKIPVPWRMSKDNAFSRDEGGGVARQHPKLRKGTADRMRAKGINEAICRAFEKTGLCVTQENWASIPKSQQKEWENAIEDAQDEIEWEELFPD